MAIALSPLSCPAPPSRLHLLPPVARSSRRHGRERRRLSLVLRHPLSGPRNPRQWVATGVHRRPRFPLLPRHRLSGLSPPHRRLRALSPPRRHLRDPLPLLHRLRAPSPWLDHLRAPSPRLHRHNPPSLLDHRLRAPLLLLHRHLFGPHHRRPLGSHNLPQEVLCLHRIM